MIFKIFASFEQLGTSRYNGGSFMSRERYDLAGQKPDTTIRCQHPHNRIRAKTPRTPMLLGYGKIQISLKISYHLSRSDCNCLLPASPLNADRLSVVRPLQLLLEVEASGSSFTRVAAISSARSRSVSRGIGIAAEGESLAVSAACA